jgi:hypothetical protein
MTARLLVSMSSARRESLFVDRLFQFEGYLDRLTGVSGGRVLLHFLAADYLIEMVLHLPIDEVVPSQ